ncbi:MAG: hypothetical protein J6M60_01975 [Clostridia bacterium]|nr:hypothetical protein [Clostridia bacterium]
MGKKQLDLELNKHLEDVISSRKVSLESTQQTALNLWKLICQNHQKHQSKKVIVQHYANGKVVTTMYTAKPANTPQSMLLTAFVDEKLIDVWPDFELLPILSIIAGNSDVEGKCRLCENNTCKELHLDFK